MLPTISTIYYDGEGFDSDAHTIITHREEIVVELLGQLVHDAPADIYELLAQRLDLEQVVISTRLSQHRRAGLFDHTGNERAQGTGLSLEKIQALVEPILSASRDVTKWVAELTKLDICRDESAANRVAYSLRSSHSIATDQARQLVNYWHLFGHLGLLRLSNYPYTDELLRLHEYTKTIQESLGNRSEFESLLAMLRADVVALARALQEEHLLGLYRMRYGKKARLYDQSLLHQPSGSQARIRFKERLDATVREQALITLAVIRGCDRATAEMLLVLFIEHGLSEIVRWRSDGHLRIQDLHVEPERIERATRVLISGLAKSSQEKIKTRLGYLQEAVTDTGATISIFPFIRDLPSSPRRRRLQQRSVPDEVVQAFAERLNEQRSMAWSYIRNLRIYGPLGMLKPSEWSNAIHPRLWSYLHLFKLGRIEDTIDESALTGAVNGYAAELAELPLARQVVTGIYRHFSKPHYYNSGDGEAIAGVPLRKSLKLAGVHRLHERWIVLPVPLDVQPVDMSLRPIGERSIATLVFDWGSERPLAVWVSPDRAGEREAGLALFHAIWHPDAVDWPLRGIPENIIVSRALAQENLEDICRSAAYLLASVEAADDTTGLLKELPFVRTLIKELQEVYERLRLGRRRGPPRQMTITQLREELRTWLYQRSFPDHRSVPPLASLRRNGYALPGFDTPAAGWLLPSKGVYPTVRDGVEVESFAYTDVTAGIEPGLEVAIRSFGDRPKAVFANYNGSLHFLSFSKRNRTQ
jgi:hypothetical protein